MGVFEDFVDVVKQTETMQALLQNLEREPAKLLAAVCREYEATKKKFCNSVADLGICPLCLATPK